MSGCPFNHEPAEAPDGGTRGLSRRGLFSLAGVGGAGAVAGLAAGYLSHDAVAAMAAPAGTGSSVVPFYGERQAGIVTPAQDRLHMAAFDVTVEDRAALIQLLKDWTAAAEAMTAGRTTGATGAVDGPYDAPPGGHRRSSRSGGRQADVDVRLWPGPLRKGRQAPLQPGGPQTRRPDRPAAFPGRCP
ncbi:hypothetical protein ABH924_004956 [Arthrobacter sp. GAS37]